MTCSPKLSEWVPPEPISVIAAAAVILGLTFVNVLVYLTSAILGLDWSSRRNTLISPEYGNRGSLLCRLLCFVNRDFMFYALAKHSLRYAIPYRLRSIDNSVENGLL